MQKSFDSGKFVSRIGVDLIRAFEGARHATTPELVGDAMEQPVRDRLEQILPRGIGVGSGCIIDTKGNSSRQMDVVLYEKDICPVFCINNSPETTYYPCEGVIAVGEVKSAIGSKEMEDAFRKVKSVKCLERNFHERNLPPLEGKAALARHTRHYGQTADTSSVVQIEFQSEPYKPAQDIFAFVLAERASIKVNSLFSRYAEMMKRDGVNSPNIIVFLDGAIFSMFELQENGGKPVLSIEKGNCVGRTQVANPFSNLLRWIYIAYHEVRTSEVVVFGKYFSEQDGHDGKSALHEYVPIKLVR